MRPDYIIISAWGPYKDRVEIDFKRFQGNGLFLITGSTGAGKTTIFDAITYALYGTLSGETREKGSVRSDFAVGEVPTFVELTMTHRGQEYRIVRNPEYLRPKKKKSGVSELTKEKENAVLYMPDGKIIEGIKEVNAKIQEILVLAPDQFKQISMIAQGQFSKMLTAPAKDKINIFREIFGTGIYERFAKNLRERSGALYVKVSEQKHKMEEDIRLLLESVDLETTVISDGQAELRGVTETDNWNYDAIGKCLTAWKKELEEELTQCEKNYGEEDKQVSLLTEKLTTLQEQNRKLLQCEQACKKRNDLISQRENYEEKEQKVRRAEGATVVQGKEMVLLTLLDQKDKNNTRYQNLQKEIEDLGLEKEKLQVIYDNREKVEEFYQLSQALHNLKTALADCENQCAKAEEEHKKITGEYCVIEKDRDVIKEEYDRADRRYKHAIIGIAAGMLVEGNPCPVCGSISHPAPAKTDSDLLSEEELLVMKEKLEKKEKTLLAVGEKATVLFAALQSLLEKKKGLEKEYTETNKACEDKKTLFAGLGISLEQAEGAQIRSSVTRYDQISGLVQSKSDEMSKLKTEILAADERIQEAKRVFLQVLAEKGFETEDEFRQAVLPEREREQIERELVAYKEELAGAVSLAEHLEQETKGLEYEDETERKTVLEQAKERRETVRQKQRKLAGLEERLILTKSSIKEKQEKISKISAEYGYVKDLDNLASGNNKKRMVFEQYVLTGYFDRILQAANIRFSYMTGGRYEMSRMEEISDGRTKNSLEIEVMDYYTGKMRSVKTLSGGESFKASLSLALGLSDVIQAMNGGIKVDALFVDEGFGALDSESLDQACETLQGLVEQSRMIGIISHVQELRERIDNQIVVEKTNQGSRVREVFF